MKTHTGKYFSEYATEKKQVFPLFRLVWLPMEPPGRSGQRVSSFICHQLLTQNCIVLDFGQALFFTILLSYFGIPIHLQNYLIELPINQTRCSCQWKKSYCGLLRSNEDTAACFAIVCFFVGTSQAFAGHSALKDALAATMAGAYLPHSASKRS